jgi:hypothetical protein
LRFHRFELLLGDRAQLREPTTNELREVAVSETRGLPWLPQIDFDARMERREPLIALDGQQRSVARQ